jgi:hypothetical protein
MEDPPGDTPVTPVNPPQDTSNPAGGDLTVPKMKFDQDVYPILKMKCGNAGCHAQEQTAGSITKFVATTATDGWKLASETVALRGNFTSGSAPVLTYVKPGNHKGAVYSAQDEAKIVGWLDAEVAARNGQPSTPPPMGQETLSQATERVLSKFAGCMTLANFTAANMIAWGNVNAQNNQQCKDCHVTGGEGFIASDTAGLFYETVSSKKYFFLQYFTVDLTQGAAAAKVVINRASFIGVSQGLDPHREHPTFNATNNQGMTALTNFYNATMNNAACGAPKPLANQ